MESIGTSTIFKRCLDSYLGLEKYGKDWRKIEKIIATRSSSQIRSHAQKFFSKLRKSGKNNFLISPVSTIN